MKNNIKIIIISAILVLVIAAFIGIITNKQIPETEIIENNSTEPNIELNINNLDITAMVSLDIDVETIETNSIPVEIEFINKINIPNNYKEELAYIAYTRENVKVAEYNVLHDYVFRYADDEHNTIKISFSNIEQPLRDYFISTGKEISKIGDTELIIAGDEDRYITTFKYKNMFFDVETKGVKENELVELLKSIITNDKDVIVYN